MNCDEFTQEQRARELASEIFWPELLQPIALRIARINALIDAVQKLRQQSILEERKRVFKETL